MSSRGPRLRAALNLTLMSAILTGCVTTSTPTVGTKLSTTSAICNTFPAITYSSKDTDLTIRQVRGHNAAVEAVCKQYWLETGAP